MRTRNINIIVIGILALTFLTQCSSPQASPVTEAPPTSTSVPPTPTSVPPTPTSPPPSPTPDRATPTSQTLTPTSAVLDGARLVQERCTVCHTTERIENSAKTRDEWEDTVKRMIGKGANLTSDEKDLVINYLAETYKK